MHHAIAAIGLSLLAVGAAPLAPAAAPFPPPAAPLAAVAAAGTAVQAQWRWPVDPPRSVLRPFVAPATAFSAGHRGIDIRTSSATVYAPADGVVHFVGVVVDRPVLSIRHADGLVSSYEPVEATVVAGQSVSRGEPMGTVLAGHCASVCLHFGVRLDGVYVSPLRWLGGIPRSVLLPTRWPVTQSLAWDSWMTRPANTSKPRWPGAWLAENHSTSAGVFVVSWRSGTGRPAMTYDEMVEQAMCFGWVDSRAAKIDDERTMLWFTPRKSGSGWARPNKERIERMLAAGLMHPTGLAVIEAAKADGTWTMLAAVERLEVPSDLDAALAALPGSRRNWDAFPRSVRRGILEWIVQAKTPPTREKRVRETAEKAALNERANQWTPKA